MKKTISDDGIFPRLMGSEHELSILFTKRHKFILTSDELPDDELKYPDLVYKDATHPWTFYEAINDHVIVGLDDYVPSIKVLHNGGVVSSISDRPLEIATPECFNPKQLITYSIASRLLLKKWLCDYLNEQSSDLRSISINERVIDSHGNTWGEHDNYSLHPEESGIGAIESVTPQVLWLHLLTRGTVTGSGVVNGGGGRCWSTSQKIPTVSSIYDKKWGSTAMWGDNDRLEIRCSDKNVSEWAHLIRIGSAALVLALARNGFSIESIGINSDQLDMKKVGDYDGLHVQKNGETRLTYEAKIGITVQRVLAEASLELIDKYDQSASQYAFIAKEWLAFAERLEKASQLDGSLDLSSFLESDWAAKFYGIQNRIQKDNKEGVKREPDDYTSRAQDILYDRILLDAPLAGEKVYEAEGTGFKLNKCISARKIINQKDAVTAMDNAPNMSRAEARSDFIRFLVESGCTVNSFDWSSVTWLDLEGESHERSF